MIQEYLEHKKINGVSAGTLKQYRSLFNTWESYKPIEKWEKKDITSYILKLKNEGKCESTIEGQKVLIKNFFNWAEKPDFVKTLEIKRVSNNLDKNDILTPEDVDKLIEVTASPMYKALIALLFESGARINEILSVRVIDCIEDDKGLIVSVHQTKTGKDMRRVLCVHSGQYIRNHIDHSSKSKEDLLFDVSNPSVWEMLKKIAKKAGIDKPISAHKFRHAEATLMVQQGYNEAIIRKKLGWSAASNMIARYQHLDDDDVINATHDMKNQGRTAEEIALEIQKKREKNIKSAEEISIANPSILLLKLNEENQELKERMAQRDAEMEKRDADFEDLKRKMETFTAILAAKQG
ncbi:MAG: tyrosine-type recombinase/integrase [Candidatus Methanoperedens sp.]|nr:tyrosine-type recombinase/integrase [Candidatus Methanoperedens sp.]